MKLLISLKIVFVLLVINFTAFSQSKQWMKEEADDYFKVGRYWDAFFKYREIARLTDFQGNIEVEQQIKNSSRAMYLWKKTEDYRAFRKFELAKNHLKDLLVLNPEDPNKGVLPRLTLEQANEFQRMAHNQRTAEGTQQYIAKAIELYNLALNEGLKDELVYSLIKQCEHALSKTGGKTNIKLPTSYGINYEKQVEAQRQREVKIIKEEKKDNN